MDLLPSQRAELFSMLEGSGIAPSRVQLTSVGSEFARGKSVPAVALRGTKYYFIFDSNSARVRVSRFSPGSEHIEETEAVASWGDQLMLFARWCSYLERELNVSDPWADLERQAVPFQIDASHQSSSQPFKVAEFERALKMLNALQALLLTYARDNEVQQGQIKAEIAKLVEGAKTQDRKSWFFMVVGFIASTAVSMALAPDQTRALYEQLKLGLNGVVRLIAN